VFITLLKKMAVKTAPILYAKYYSSKNDN